MMQRRKFSKGFKVEPLNMVLGRGVSIAQVARDLDISENLISRWIRVLGQSEQQVLPVHELKNQMTLM